MTFPKLLMNFKTMNTTDTLTLKALQLKQTIGGGGDGGQMLDHILAANPDAAKESLRNICAFITKELFADVEQMCTNLGLSKRVFVEMALIDIIEKCKEIIARHDVFESIDNTKGE